MKKLYRCRWDKKIGGVCGGLGQYFRWDPTILRLILIFLCIITVFAPFILAYIVMWAITPVGPTTYVEIPCKKLYRARYDRKISGVCGGLANYFKIDANLVRILFIILMFTTFIAPLLICYLIATFIIPENPDEI